MLRDMEARPPSLANIPVARPRLPMADSILPFLQEIDSNAWYTNHGPLSRRLQAKLASHWALEAAEVALVSNATVGLTLALRATGARAGSHCLLPSWTFAASAGAVVAAGLVPHFVDVRPDTWTPDPTEIRRLVFGIDVGAVLIVAPFGAPIDMAAWNEVQSTTGIPVIIDAAAAFDTLRAGGPMQAHDCPLVVSLHATKVFGIGEGGAVLSRDITYMERVRALSQFGFSGTRNAMLPGTNGKLSEYTAAVGLAVLESWQALRAEWKQVTQHYTALLPNYLELPPCFGNDWVSSTLNIVVREDRASLCDDLAAEGVATLRWWGMGCHAQPAYMHYPSEKLPVTESLATRSLGIPFWPGLQHDQISTVCRTLDRLVRRPTQRQLLVRVPEAI